MAILVVSVTAARALLVGRTTDCNYLRSRKTARSVYPCFPSSHLTNKLPHQNVSQYIAISWFCIHVTAVELHVYIFTIVTSTQNYRGI